MPPEERQDEISSVMRDIQGLLSQEADLGLSALAAAEAGSLDRLADVSEELLTCHVKYATKYRRLMGLWLRPTSFAGLFVGDQHDQPGAVSGVTAPTGPSAG